MALWVRWSRRCGWCCALVSDRVTTWIVGPEKAPENILQIDEFRTLVDEVANEGELHASERTLIYHLLDAGATEIVEIMTPRTRMAFIDGDSPLPEALERFRALRHSRVPVFRGPVDQSSASCIWKTCCRWCSTNRTCRTNASRTCCARWWWPADQARGRDVRLLPGQQQTRAALVIDEFGGVEGIVTIRDVLTFIFGDAAVVVLLILQGFFSGSEIALVSCDKAKLRHRAGQGHTGSRLALRMLRHPEVILATTLIGTNICLVLNTALVTAATIAALGAEGDLLAVLMLTPCTLVLGEIVPKSVYQQQADALTPRIIFPLYVFSLLLYPLVLIFARTARLATRLSGHGGTGTELFAVREQLRTVLDTVEGAANVDVFDAERIRNVVRFGELAAGDVMIPAAEMTAIEADRGTADVVRLVRRTGQTHFPVYEDERHDVIGMICASLWDVVAPGFADRSIRDLLQPAHFVPLQQPLVELLPVLRDREDQSAIVVDEYGSAVGLITVDGILETVVGRVEVGSSFEQHADPHRPGYQQLEDGAWLMDARLPIPEVNELLGTSIGQSASRTIGGLIVSRLRHVPEAGESVVEGGYRFEVVESTDRAVTRLRAERASRGRGGAADHVTR
jgi:putative hemolysin